MSSAVTEGFIEFKREGEAYKTYYKLFGSLEGRIHDPLIVLHGGPGLCHDYLFPFQALAQKHNIPVILYDQIGNGKSTHLKEKDPTFWTIDLFIDELVNLINHFGIQDGFNLAGHSWGGVVALEYEVRRQPAGLKRLVVSNSLSSYDLWNQSVMMLVEPFPDDVKMGLAGGIDEPEKFLDALKAFHEVHGCTIRPIPLEYWYALEVVFGKNGDRSVASAPLLKDWSIIDRLHLVRVPTLIIRGRKDISQDFVVAPFLEKIPRVKERVFEGSAHAPFIEETDNYMTSISEFLGVDSE